MATEVPLVKVTEGGFISAVGAGLKRVDNTMRSKKGFSLIELLIVVAIILIIAAIAIPNLLRARISANEGSAVSCMRTINTAQFAYNTSYPTVGYATALADLGPATAPD